MALLRGFPPSNTICCWGCYAQPATPYPSMANISVNEIKPGREPAFGKYDPDREWKTQIFTGPHATITKLPKIVNATR